MKLIGLKIDGLRKLSAVEMEFAEKGLVQLRGKNEQGKTTVIDAIQILLQGGKFIENDMIQHGEDKAQIVGYFDNYIVKRVITKKSDRLEIRDKKGLLVDKKPQQFLDKFVNALSFDPRPFLNKTASQKLMFMMDLLKIDFTEIDKKITNHEAERLLLGREINRAGELVQVAKVEGVDINKLLEQKKDIDIKNDTAKEDYQQRKEEGIQAVHEHNNLQKQRQEEINSQGTCLKQELEMREKTLKDLEIMDSLIKERKQKIKTLLAPEPEKELSEIDVVEPGILATSELETQISKATETNKKANEYDTYIDKRAKQMEKQNGYDSYTKLINSLRNEKKCILSKVNIPVEGLEIREDGLFHNGTFSENWSEVEGLKISSELCVAMAPELRAIFLDKGESYDQDNLKALREWAEKKDFLAFITIVDSTKDVHGNGVFYIEEGKIAEKGIKK